MVTEVGKDNSVGEAKVNSFGLISFCWDHWFGKFSERSATYIPPSDARDGACRQEQLANVRLAFNQLQKELRLRMFFFWCASFCWGRCHGFATSYLMV